MARINKDMPGAGTRMRGMKRGGGGTISDPVQPAPAKPKTPTGSLGGTPRPSNPFTPPPPDRGGGTTAVAPPRTPVRTAAAGVGGIAPGGDRNGYLSRFTDSPGSLQRGFGARPPMGSTGGAHPQINDQRILNPISDPKGFTSAIGGAAKGNGALSKPTPNRSSDRMVPKGIAPRRPPGPQTPTTLPSTPVATPRMQAQGLRSDMRALRSGMGGATRRNRSQKRY